MFTQILVPLDGSALAERALPYAERLAGAGRATLHLVRVVDLLAAVGFGLAPAPIPQEVYDREMQQATAYLEAQRARLEAAGLPTRAVSLTGPVAPVLLDYEREHPIDLVALCSHGRSGLARFALGSVAERLLRYGTAPLLLARAFGPSVPLERAIVPLDGSPRAEQTLTLVESLAGAPLQEVTLLRVLDAYGPLRVGAEAELEECAQGLRARGLQCQWRVEEGDPAERILAAAGTERLVIMATHGRMGVARWALGSVADRVARGGAGAVLLVRSIEASLGAGTAAAL